MAVISCLLDNRARPGFASEHGLSLFIEHDGAAVLLDTGQSGLFADNAQRMGVDLATTTHLVLSHGHYDHSGGLARALQCTVRQGGVDGESAGEPTGRPEILLHPDALTGRSARRDSGAVEFIGMSAANRRLLEERGVTRADGPVTLAQGLLYLGQIPRPDPEACSLIGMTEDGGPDAILDDTGLALMTGKGLVVITGCAHSGIINTVEYALALTGAAAVYAVVGGLHCKGASEAYVQKTHDYLKARVSCVYGCHCTGDALRDKGLGLDFMAGDRLEVE